MASHGGKEHLATAVVAVVVVAAAAAMAADHMAVAGQGRVAVAAVVGVEYIALIPHLFKGSVRAYQNSIANEMCWHHGRNTPLAV